MATASFTVRLTDSALADLYEIDDFWCLKGEPSRGEQYVRNLIDTAERDLSVPIRALAGRLVRVAILPETREILVYKGSYRIIYRIDALNDVVHVLRFWHSHRD